MPIPTIRDINGDNLQLVNMAALFDALSLTEEEQAAYKADLAAEYRRQIEATHNQLPVQGAALASELEALLTRPTSDLVSIPLRGYVPGNNAGQA
jgi:hypothetical protein